jgi:uncharacterized protein YigE (DUF2233 family)
MTNKHKFFGLIFLIFSFGTAPKQEKDSRFLSFVTDPSSIKFYWKDDKGQIFRSIQNLKSFIEISSPQSLLKGTLAEALSVSS